MSDVSSVDLRNEATTGVTKSADALVPVTESKWYSWRKNGMALINYLLDSEVHTYAFSVAANAIISFIPFIVLLYTISHSIFHSTMMEGVIGDMVRYFMPSNQDFVAKNLDGVAIAASQHGVQIFSLVMILVACTGIFLPLEVALNQAWGVTKSRNYLFNQAVAFGLAILMLVLGMGSILLNAGLRDLLTIIFVHNTNIKFIDIVLHFTYQGTSFVLLTVTTGVASILFFFSIYWILPNCKVPWRPVLRVSIYTGIIWLAAKYVFWAVLPHMDLKSLYGPFYVSVGLLFWAYVSGLILFAGAQFSVARWGQKQG